MQFARKAEYKKYIGHIRHTQKSTIIDAKHCECIGNGYDDDDDSIKNAFTKEKRKRESKKIYIKSLSIYKWMVQRESRVQCALLCMATQQNYIQN